jgi:hypothetical protein
MPDERGGVVLQAIAPAMKKARRMLAGFRKRAFNL